MKFLDRYQPYTLSVLRIMSGLLLLQFGTTKHLDFPVSDRNGASLMTMSGFAGLLELVGGIMLVLGLFTRPVAFVLSGLMAAAYFIGHAPNGFFPILNGGNLAVLFCFTFLYIACAGGGPLSIPPSLKHNAARALGARS